MTSPLHALLPLNTKSPTVQVCHWPLNALLEKGNHSRWPRLHSESCVISLFALRISMTKCWRWRAIYGDYLGIPLYTSPELFSSNCISKASQRKPTHRLGEIMVISFTSGNCHEAEPLNLGAESLRSCHQSPISLSTDSSPLASSESQYLSVISIISF